MDLALSPASPRSLYPVAFSVLAPTPSSTTCRMVRYRHSPGAPTSCRSFRLSRRCRPTRCTLHRCSRLSHYPPFLTHSISNPFLIRTAQMRVLSPSPTPFEFRGTPCFPLTPSVSWLRGRERETQGCSRWCVRTGMGEGESVRQGSRWVLKTARLCALEMARRHARSASLFEGVFPGRFGGHLEPQEGNPAIDCGDDSQPSGASSTVLSLTVGELSASTSAIIQRRTSTGILVWLSTLAVSLPISTAWAPPAAVRGHRDQVTAFLLGDLHDHRARDRAGLGDAVTQNAVGLRRLEDHCQGSAGMRSRIPLVSFLRVGGNLALRAK